MKHDHTPPTKPNLVLIMSDDQGYGDLASYGAPLLKTPNLDGIGRRGMRFTQHYSGSPVCTPSRAALLTGAWPPRVNMPNVLNPGQAQGMPQQETLLSEYLKGAGYATGHFGKWHLGDPAADPAHHPMNHGFDTWYGIPYSNDYPTIPVYNEHEIVDTIVYPGALGQDAGNGDEQDWLNSSIFEHAIDWIATQPRDTPFFAYITPSQPHEPVASEFEGSAGGPHGSSIEEMDQLVGQIIRQLDKMRVRENTCIIFTSDNGPWWVGDTGGLSGRKSETYEGGMRVPFVMEWPNMMRGGWWRDSDYDAPTGHIDVLPTFCAAAGIPLLADRIIDGQNLLPAIQSGREMEHVDIAYYQGNTLNALRHGDWKLHVRRQNGLSRHTGLVDWSATDELPHLVHLGRDPEEYYDVSERYPDVLADMQNRLTAFDTALKADRAARYGS